MSLQRSKEKSLIIIIRVLLISSNLREGHLMMNLQGSVENRCKVG